MNLIQKGSSELLNKKEAWERFVEEEDEVAFEHLFKNYYQSMFGYGIKLCNQPEHVRDCIQELFKNIWERRNDLAHIESPNVYLFVSLRRKILKKDRSFHRCEKESDKIDGDQLINFGKEDLIIKNEVKIQKKEELQEALNQLSNQQKEVVYLHFYSGMSYGEIEQILSINRQSVRNHIYRAMETLRSLLDSEIMKLVVSVLITILIFV
jgi:RNA polymerase sigma factor (sigma-70 family)